jgi:hypothetical protein
MIIGFGQKLAATGIASFFRVGTVVSTCTGLSHAQPASGGSPQAACNEDPLGIYPPPTRREELAFQ